MVKGLVPEPVDELRSIICAEDIVNRVFWPERRNAFCNRQQK